MLSTMLVTECNIILTVYWQVTICHYVTCHNIMNNVCHFDGQMYVLCNINIKYITKC